MLNRMHIYTVHAKEGGAIDALGDVHFVREGFNIFAFLFGFIWALYHRCWLFALILFGLLFSIDMLFRAELLSQAGVQVATIGVSVIAGMMGNDARRASLIRRGFKLIDITTGENMIRSQQRFFDRFVGL